MNNRIIEFKAICRHRMMVQAIAKSKGFSFPFHDFIKSINVLLIGDMMATKLHRRFSSHHIRNGKIKNVVEACIDWESARFTKPTKPLNAWATYRKYYEKELLPAEREKFEKTLTDLFGSEQTKN